jgi:hypothetical protein
MRRETNPSQSIIRSRKWIECREVSWFQISGGSGNAPAGREGFSEHGSRLSVLKSDAARADFEPGQELTIQRHAPGLKDKFDLVQELRRRTGLSR